MSHRHRRPLQELDDEISVARSEKRVFDNGREPKLLSEELSVDVEGVSGQRSTSQRQSGDSGKQRGEPGKVSGEGEGMGKKEMGPSNRLGSLFERNAK